MTDFKKMFPSKLFTRILCIIGIVIVALLIFQTGVFVGYHKAAFSYRWGQEYYHTFGGHRFPSSHGAIGKIIKVDLPTFIMEGPDKTEQVVLTTDTTIVRRFRDVIKPSDLKPDDYVVVIGSPNDKSQIEARFIRLVPAPQN